MLEVILCGVLFSAAFAQPIQNDTDPQKPTEEKQGGEYSGLNETGRQDQGLPNEKANPTPQAPITGVEVGQPNDAETAETFVEPSEPSNWPLVGGAGAAFAGAAVIAVLYFRSRNRHQPNM